MNKQDVKKMNMAIEEFMGVYEKNGWMILPHRRYALSTRHYPATLKYRSDWSWLMPVWFKFRDLRFQEELHQFRHSNLKELISRAICYEDIEIAHQRLFEAIKWYNENVKK